MNFMLIYLQNKKFLVNFVSGHDGVFLFIVGDVVFPDVHHHLMLLQKQQQLQLISVVLPAQGTFQQSPSKQTK